MGKQLSARATSFQLAANQANNQIVGYSYDANGNQLGAPGFSGSPIYDAENRMVAAPGVQYAYDSQNKRVWSGTINGSNNLTGQTAYFYGVNGQLIGSYSLYVNYGAGQYLEFSDPPVTQAVYFGGKRVGTTQSGTTTAYWQDWLGSNRNNAVHYYPWGEARGTNPQDTWSYATYWQDSATDLDYADQRYYGNVQGRFMTPDPYTNSGWLGDPQSWNRYAYTRGDPVNRRDPGGTCDEDTDTTVNVCDTVDDPFDGWWGVDGPFNNGPSFGYACAFGFISGCSPTTSTTAIGGGYGPPLTVSQIGGIIAAEGLHAVADTVFSANCENFINASLGAGALQAVQALASQTTTMDVSTVNTAAGAAQFPNNPDLAALAQATANQKTGIAGASLAQLAAVSPNVYAYGQYSGNTVFYNATAFSNFGNGMALYIMLHEMLHVAGLGGDTQIEAAFGISAQTVQAQGSMSITYKLMAECGN
jgi:RHS repeat-associated protein